MKHNAQGFGAIGILLVVAVAALIATGGVVVLNHKKSSGGTATQSSSNTPSAKQASKVAVSLTLDESKLPAGWKKDAVDTGNILVRNEANNCFANIMFTNDTVESNAPSLDHYKDTLRGISGKGYVVTELAATPLTLHTDKGDTQVPSHTLKVTLDSEIMYQDYAYVSTAAHYGTIQTSCASQADLPRAREALLAIKLINY